MLDWKTTTTLLAGLEEASNDDAWNGFLERFRPPVRAFLLGRGVAPDEAEDLVQEVLLNFVELYRERRYDRDRGRLSGWLFGIAHNHALRSHERGRRYREKLDELTIAEQEPEMWDLWRRHWQDFVLRESLRRVRAESSARSFAAFEATVLKGRSPEEAASELGVDVKAIYNARHRVLRRMRELRAEIEGADES